jgi:Zn-dependent protease/predicted transcriptional regulator
MRGSFRIATIFNIPVHIHWTFGLLLMFVMGLAYVQGHNVVLFSASVLALFFCVLLHEFGHALAARYYGVDTRDITLLPIGGVARLYRLPEKPLQEFVVAIAGPLVNLLIYSVLALVLYFVFNVSFSLNEILNSDTEQIIIDPTVQFIATLMQANFILVLFNMIPAFPMDGGRVLRAILAHFTNRADATKWAAGLGQILAVCFVVGAALPMILSFLPEESSVLAHFDWVSWSFQPILMLVAGFVFYTARAENKQVKQEESLKNTDVQSVMRTHYNPMQSGDLMFTAISEMKKGYETNFLVFDDAQVLRGVLEEDDIMDAMQNQHNDALISTYTNQNFISLKPTDRLKQAYDVMLQNRQYSLPVVDTEGGVLGILEWGTLLRVMQIVQ